jgi:hypothetical protein
LFVKCAECGDIEEKEEACKNDKGELICRWCLEDKYDTCDSCGVLKRRSEMYYTGWNCYCEHCIGDKGYYCDRCGGIKHNRKRRCRQFRNIV